LANQFLDFWFPNKQHKDNESLQAVEKISKVEDVRRFNKPRNRFHCPSGTHDDEQTKIKEKPGIEFTTKTLQFQFCRYFTFLSQHSAFCFLQSTFSAVLDKS
jgi:hypothetical protein